MFWYTHQGVVVPAEQTVAGRVCGPRVLFRKTAKGMTDRYGRRWSVDPVSGRAYRKEGAGMLCAVGVSPVEGFTHKARVFTGRPGIDVQWTRVVEFTPAKPKFTDHRGDVWRVARQNGTGSRWNASIRQYEHLAQAVERHTEGEEIVVWAGEHVAPPVKIADLPVMEDDEEEYNNGTLREKGGWISAGNGGVPCE